MLQLVVGDWPPAEWVSSSVVLLVVQIVFSIDKLLSVGDSLVERRHISVVGSPVVASGWLKVVEMGEGGALTGSQVEDLLGETIPDTIWLLVVDEPEDVVLDDWALRDDGRHSSGEVSGDAVTEGEDVLEPSVLEGVFVDINHASGVGDSSLNKPLVWL